MSDRPQALAALNALMGNEARADGPREPVTLAVETLHIHYHHYEHTPDTPQRNGVADVEPTANDDTDTEPSVNSDADVEPGTNNDTADNSPNNGPSPSNTNANANVNTAVVIRPKPGTWGTWCCRILKEFLSSAEGALGTIVILIAAYLILWIVAETINVEAQGMSGVAVKPRITLEKVFKGHALAWKGFFAAVVMAIVAGWMESLVPTGESPEEGKKGKGKGTH